MQQNLGLKNDIIKTDNDKAGSSRKHFSRAAGVKNLGNNHALDRMIFDLILWNFNQVCIFQPHMQITRESRHYTDQYNEDLWLSNLCIYEQKTFTPKFIMEYSYTENTLRAYFRL